MTLSAQSPKTLGFSYRIYCPSGRHRGFRIMQAFPNGKWESVKNPALDLINKNLNLGEIDPVQARKHVEKLRQDLYGSVGIKRAEIVFNSENRKILNKYWNAEYVPRLVRLEDPDTALFELQRSVDAVGKVSLLSGSRNHLQAALDSKLKGNLQRRAAGKLNAILKFLGRDFQLIKAKKEFKEVRYLTPEEFKMATEQFDDELLRLIHKVGFATGLRLGEIMAMESRLYNRQTNTLKVLFQIDKKGIKRKTKNRKDRSTFVFPEFKKDIERWLEVSSSFPHEIRLRISRITKKACRKALKNKVINFHDLRHSYAINLLSKGVPLSHVAQCLGDSIPVAQEYYVGFELSADALSFINNIVDQG